MTNKRYNISAYPAAETFVVLLRVVDCKAGGFFMVKGAATPMCPPFLFQGKISRGHGHDIVRQFNLFNEVLGEEGGFCHNYFLYTHRTEHFLKIMPLKV